MKEVADVDALAASIGAALAGQVDRASGIIILEQKQGPDWSTSPAKVVRCRLEDGTELSLFCKLDFQRGQHGLDHRQGLLYEAWVYRNVLEPLEVSTPRFLGAHSDPSTGATWLMLEYLEGCTYPSMVDAQQFADAARWIAQFHVLGAKCHPSLSADRLARYDRDYYLGWARRTADLTRDVHDQYPWLPVLCDRFSHLVDSLCVLEATVIHGEYYHKNILFRKDQVYPIDWESAALGPGEIDLAALVERWPLETIQPSLDEYLRTRWPGGAPEDFERRLDLAKLYLHFRWLGTNPEWMMHRNLWRIKDLLPLGKRLRLV